MKWNLQFSDKSQNWQISQLLCIGELEVKVLILEVGMVNACQFAPNIFSITSKLYWGPRPRCNPKNLILQIFDFICLILWHWYQKKIYMWETPFGPLIWGPKGFNYQRKDKIIFFLAHCIEIIMGGKNLGIYVLSYDKPKIFQNFQNNWENWEIFANFCYRNF